METQTTNPSRPTTTPETGTTGSPMAGTSPSAAGRGDLMDRVVQGAHRTIDRLAEGAAPRVQRLSEGMTSTGERMHAQVDHMREVGDEWTESLRSTVRDHPLAALGFALAAGMLIARLTK